MLDFLWVHYDLGEYYLTSYFKWIAYVLYLIVKLLFVLIRTTGALADGENRLVYISSVLLSIIFNEFIM